MAVVSAPHSSVASRASFLGLDWPLLLVTIMLAVWGVFTVVSATQPAIQAPAAQSRPATTRTAPVESSRIPDATKQIAFVVVGVAAMLALAFLDYRWLMHLQGWVYGLNLVSLLIVLLIGREVNGAKSWIIVGPISLQMSEFSKIAVLLSLAAFLTRKQEKIGEMKTILLSLLYLAPPLLLILKQPDFGTMLATLSIWFGMLFFGGARLKHLLGVLIVAGFVFAAAWQVGILKPHQTARLASFINPNAAPEAGGYQLRQSLIAIGSGQITGQGYGQGMQNQARYVPENNTDFIFTVVAEELGFAGGAALLAAYLFLLFRTSSLAMSADNYFGVLLCGGFTALLAFHCIINMGMTMRVMPITGVPLPFFSYGGSSFLAFSLGVGLLQSVSAHGRR
ncbi:MAG: rod shape-determining protein RodA [Armatimonadetes bacterium]|nr:rod shape-determining protein RodA [Armatimonadota bacterium]